MKLQAEYETIGESTGPARVRTCRIEFDIKQVTLHECVKAKPGVRFTIRFHFPHETNAFVGIAIVQRSTKKQTAALWHLLDTDYIQLQEGLARILPEEERAA